MCECLHECGLPLVFLGFAELLARGSNVPQHLLGNCSLASQGHPATATEPNPPFLSVVEASLVFEADLGLAVCLRDEVGAQ